MPLPPPYQLRPMTAADIPAVLAVEAAGYPSSTSAASAAAAYRRELSENEHALYSVLTAGDEEMIGHGGLWLLGDEAQIMIIVVHPAWRGRGLGEALFIYLLQQALAHHAARVTLEVRRGNAAARQLYRKYGFRVVGERKGYYHGADGGREDALLMDSPELDEAYGARLRDRVARLGRASAAESGPAPCTNR